LGDAKCPSKTQTVMRMLIIDDSKPMRTLLASMAREISFLPQEAADGCMALDMLVRNDPREPFAVALVDWEMPCMNGLEFVQTVRRNSSFDGLKLMMITTQNSMERVDEALKAGADDFLMKPITREMLVDKLQILGVLD
jgi:two-component system, chemotaxis family, chemotaxis protein CheY